MLKCSKCSSRKAVIDLKYMGEKYCGNCFVNLYEKRVRRTIRKHDMLKRDEKIGLAVSGGKDSLVMAHVIGKIHGETVLITVDEGISGYRDVSIKKVKKFAKERDMDLEIYSQKEEYGSTMDQVVSKKEEEDSCSYCGVFRRQLLNKAARELECDKIATGHNLDDEAQTILMNIFRGEPKRLARMGPVTGFKEHEKFIPRIKPIRRCSEKENTVYAIINNIDFESGECPYANSSYREISRNYLSEMEKNHPGTRYSILSSYDKMLPALEKYYREKSGEIENCKECGEPTSTEVCKACSMKKGLQKDKKYKAP